MDDKTLFLKLQQSYRPGSPGPIHDIRQRARVLKRRSWMLRSVALAVVVAIGLGTAAGLRAHDHRLEDLPVGGSPPPAPTLTRAFIRSTSDGVAIRAYFASGQILKSVAQGTGANVAVPIPPDSLQVELSSPTGAVERSGPISPPALTPGHSIAAVEPVTFGDASSSAMAAGIYSSPQVKEVQLVLPDGFTDEMRPVNGWSVLAGLDSGTGGQVRALDASGAVVSSIPVTFAALSPMNDPLFVRTTPDGILIRAEEDDGFLVPEVSNLGAATLFDGIPECTIPDPVGMYVVPQDTVGVKEGTPFRVVPVQVGAGIASVTVHFSDGSSDTMSAVSGVAVLGHQGVAGPTSVVAFNAAGHMVASAPQSTFHMHSVPGCPE